MTDEIKVTLNQQQLEMIDATLGGDLEAGFRGVRLADRWLVASHPHPREHVSRDGHREHARPHIQMQGLEECRRARSPPE